MLKRITSFATLALLCLASVVCYAQSEPNFPPLTGRVVDQADLLSSELEQSLTEKIAAHEAETTNQVVVVTVNSLEGYADSDYALKLGREWGIGTEEKNNGVVLLVAPNERKVRIEVGYGLEGALPDGIAGQIIRRNILPQFKEDDYPSGIESGVNAILQAVVGEYKAEPVRNNNRGIGNGGLWNFIPLLFIGVVAIPSFLRKKGLYRISNASFPAGFAGLAVSLLSTNIFLGLLAGAVMFALVYFTSAKNMGKGERNTAGHRAHRDEERGRNHRSGGGGGGFSGGGGSFGGGGASGSW